MLIIDCHVHVGLNWFSPVETVLTEMDMNGVQHALLIQHNGFYDHTYLFECKKRFPGRFEVVVDVDPESPRPEAQLDEYKRMGAVGVRYRPHSRFKTKGPYDMWKRAGELGLVVSGSTPGGPENLGPDYKKILDACPDTHVQIEHLAGLLHSKPEPPFTDFKAALDCARWPNTSIKLPGVGEILPRPTLLSSGFPFKEFPVFYEMALEAFGPQRMVWGSDYPPSGGREGYRNCLDGVRCNPVLRKDGALEWILGKSAAKIWGFKA